MPSGPRLRQGGAHGEDLRRHRLLPLRPRRRDRASASSSSGAMEGLYTPHKVKSAVTGCPRNCAEAYVKDIGLVAVEGGWEVYVGGAAGGDRAQGRPARRPSTTARRRSRLALAFLQHYREHGRVPRAHLRLRRARRASRRCARPCSTRARQRRAARALRDREGGRRPRPVARAPRPGPPEAVRRARHRARADLDRRGRRGAQATTMSGCDRIGRADDVPLLEGRSVTVGRAAHRGLPHARGLRTRSTRAARTRGGPLADGIVADSCVTCPLHGWRFDLRTGRGARRPARRRPCTRSSSATASCGCGSPPTRARRSGRREQEVRTALPLLRGRLRLVAERRGRPADRRSRATRSTPSTAARRAASRCDLPDARRTRPTAPTTPLLRATPRRALASRRPGDATIAAARRAPAGDRRRARPGRDRLLHLGPAADRGLLRRQQAREGLPRHEQRRLELAPVHVAARSPATRGAFGSDGPPPAYADIDAGRLLAAARHEHGGLPPDRLVAHPRPPGRGRVRDRASTRAARRPRAAADLHLPVRPGHRPAAAQRDART